jgi:hypothetical protein
MGTHIIKYLFFIAFLVCNVSIAFSQDCQFSNEQKYAIEEARKSMSNAQKNPSYPSYTNLVNKCSTALELVANCSQVHDIYKELIITCRVLTKSGDGNELYFYQKAISFCSEYTQLIIDPIEKETYKRLLKELNDEYKNIETIKINESKNRKDKEAFDYSDKLGTIESYKAYLETFPNGMFAKEAKERVDRLINAKLRREDDSYYNYIKELDIKEGYEDYITNFPNGFHVEEAKKEIKKIEDAADNDYYNNCRKRNIKEAYKEYLNKYPKGINANNAKKEIEKIEDYEFWEKIKNSSDINSIENYPQKYPNGLYINEVKNKLSSLYIEKGDSEISYSNFQNALYYYKKADNYKSSSDLRNKIKKVEENILYLKIQNQNNSSDCEEYLKLYPNGEYKEIVTENLCKHYYDLAKKQDKNKNHKDAKSNYLKVVELNCSNKKDVQSRINTINRKAKNKIWNDGFTSKMYYTFIFQTPLAINSKNLVGIKIDLLDNQKLKYYYSFRSSINFSVPKVNISNFYDNDKYVLTKTKENQQSNISSAIFSSGITKKIYRPIFITAGLGIGMNTYSQKYDILNIESNEENSLWLYEKNNRSFFATPEFGVHFAFYYFSIFANLNYLIPIKNRSDHITYNKFSYSMGLSFPIRQYRRYPPYLYLAYCLDFPVPNYLDFKSNSSLIGISFGSLRGMYGTIRMNSLLFKDIEHYNKSEDRGNLFINLGYGNKAFNWVYFYLGAGVLYQKTISNDGLGFDTSWKFNPEVGLNYRILHFIIRGGINVPNFRFKYDNIYITTGFGYIF